MGGGILAGGSNPQISNSFFIGNTVSATISGNGFGGALSCGSPCTLTITGTQFTSNSATHSSNGGIGGALTISGSGTHTLSDNTFTSNTAVSPANAQGGAIYITTPGTVNISNSRFIGNQVIGSGQGGAILTSTLPTVNIMTSRFELNSAAGNGDAIYSGSVNTTTLSQSCITNNGDTAVVDTSSVGIIDATGGGNILNSNWWGTSWGPRISAAGGGSAISNGDSINGNGDTVVGNVLVDVNLSSAGDNSTPPTGAWLTVAPVVAGATCQTCSSVSGGGEPRACY